MRIGGVLGIAVGAAAALLSGVAVDQISDHLSLSIGTCGAVFLTAVALGRIVDQQRSPATPSASPEAISHDEPGFRDKPGGSPNVVGYRGAGISVAVPEVRIKIFSDGSYGIEAAIYLSNESVTAP